MGEVYLALHDKIKNEVAVKILPPAQAASQETVDRFLREAIALGKVRDRNVVDIDDAGTDESGLHFIRMEYIQGLSLEEYMDQQGGPIPWKQALRLIRDAASGLGAIHRKGLFHRDVKPGNLMVCRDGSNRSRVVLMDFGLVRDTSEIKVTVSGAILGTPAFMSPEQCQGRDLDSRTDVFSLGSTLFYLLTGQLPFPGQTIYAVVDAIAKGSPPPRVDASSSKIPKSVADLTARMMAPHRENRFQKVEEVVQQIDVLLRAAVPTTSAHRETQNSAKVRTDEVIIVEPVSRSPNPVSQKSQLILRCATGLACAIAAGVFLFWGSIRTPSEPAGGTTQRLKPATDSTRTDAEGLDGARSSLQVSTGSPSPEVRPEPAVEPRRDATDASASKPGRIDRAEMVRIPAGLVQLGNDAKDVRQWLLALKVDSAKIDEALDWCDVRTDRVYVTAFLIDKHEVTNEGYARFVSATGRHPPSHFQGGMPPSGMAQVPVTNVSHEDAMAYAAWAGKSLPTDAQWLRAFRSDSADQFPWGNSWDANRANVLENPVFRRLGTVTSTPDDRSPWGVFNLVGGVDEMMRETTIRRGTPVVVARGATWKSQGEVWGAAWRPSYYTLSAASNDSTGFRCVATEN